jgi:hypothetical protein
LSLCGGNDCILAEAREFVDTQLSIRNARFLVALYLYLSQRTRIDRDVEGGIQCEWQCQLDRFSRRLIHFVLQ